MRWVNLTAENPRKGLYEACSQLVISVYHLFLNMNRLYEYIKHCSSTSNTAIKSVLQYLPEGIGLCYKSTLLKYLLKKKKSGVQQMKQKLNCRNLLNLQTTYTYSLYLAFKVIIYILSVL